MRGNLATTYTSDTYGRRATRLSSEEGTTTYTWDPLGHLTEVASADATSTYEYGISGMREKVTVETAAGVTWRESVWSGGELISERDSDYTTLTYVWGPDRTPLSLKVASYTHPSGTYYYHTDAAGSVVALTNESGEVVASYRYDAFGALTDIGGSDAWLAGRNPLRYRAYYADDETGLHYTPARYYEPATARFLSPDPAPPSAGDPLSLNAYTYCQGDPVNLQDPDGARHEAGGGANRVHDDAIELAKKGHLKEAKKVQTRYRAKISLNYLKGYRYSDAAYPAYSQAAYYAKGIWEDLGRDAALADATRRSWALTSPHDDPTGYMLSTVGATCDLLAIATSESVIGGAIFLGLGTTVGAIESLYMIGRWIDGKATSGDVAMSVIGVLPIVGLYKPLRGVARTAEAISGYGYVQDSADVFITP